MRSPSLYSHFDSKNAIYDAMFAEAWTELAAMFDADEPLPAAPRSERSSPWPRRSSTSPWPTWPVTS